MSHSYNYANAGSPSALNNPQYNGSLSAYPATELNNTLLQDAPLGACLTLDFDGFDFLKLDPLAADNDYGTQNVNYEEGQDFSGSEFPVLNALVAENSAHGTQSMNILQDQDFNGSELPTSNVQDAHNLGLGTQNTSQGPNFVRPDEHNLNDRAVDNSLLGQRLFSFGGSSQDQGHTTQNMALADEANANHFFEDDSGGFDGNSDPSPATQDDSTAMPSNFVDLFQDDTNETQIPLTNTPASPASATGSRTDEQIELNQEISPSPHLSNANPPEDGNSHRIDPNVLDEFFEQERNRSQEPASTSHIGNTKQTQVSHDLDNEVESLETFLKQLNEDHEKYAKASAIMDSTYTEVAKISAQSAGIPAPDSKPSGARNKHRPAPISTGYQDVHQPASVPSGYQNMTRPTSGTNGYQNMHQSTSIRKGLQSMARPASGTNEYQNLARPTSGTNGYQNMARPASVPNGYQNMARPASGTNGYQNMHRSASHPAESQDMPQPASKPIGSQKMPRSASKSDGAQKMPRSTSKPACYEDMPQPASKPIGSQKMPRSASKSAGAQKMPEPSPPLYLHPNIFQLAYQSAPQIDVDIIMTEATYFPLEDNFNPPDPTAPLPIYKPYAGLFGTSEAAKRHRKSTRIVPKKYAADIERVIRFGRDYWVRRIYEAMIDVSDISDSDSSIHRQRFTKQGMDKTFTAIDLEAAAHHVFDKAIAVHTRGWHRPKLYHKLAMRGKMFDLTESSLEARLSQICKCLKRTKASVDDAVRGGVTLALLCDNPVARGFTKESNNAGNKARGQRLKEQAKNTKQGKARAKSKGKGKAEAEQEAEQEAEAETEQEDESEAEQEDSGDEE
ncbi:hypothetical protein IAQ61_008446 [Plenodomus lingam]|uniref:uncharacterized protein n=1 Tax=Leptosphaeria maculans TaxID=5022 RepID=UPI003330D1BD|nr:hypothetical protein IAQ61_008446 [Plenodomus lingam]